MVGVRSDSSENRNDSGVLRRGIIAPDRDPLGRMLVDYLGAKKNIGVDVFSETVETWVMSANLMFREWESMDRLEQLALSLCRGSVLDVGAGSGCHSLYLQDQKYQVCAMDASPGCIEVLRSRGLRDIRHENFFYCDGGCYDTVLMLMNGLGIAGSIEGLKTLLIKAESLLAPGGQILADSTDISSLFEDDAFNYSLDDYSGRIDFVMQYERMRSDVFFWLYVDFWTLECLVASLGLQCQQQIILEDGRYLVRIVRAAGNENC